MLLTYYTQQATAIQSIYIDSCCCRLCLQARTLADVRFKQHTFVSSAEGELEVVWDKTDVVHMDDAMAVPATGGFYKSVAHHFYEVWTALFGRHTLPAPLP